MITLGLGPSSEPLEAEGVVAQGMVARALAARLLREDDEALARLRGLVGSDLLLVLGPFERLPWADGVQYLGRPKSAPRLLLPTTVVPNVPFELLERRVAVLMKGHAPPWAVLAEPLRLLSGSASLPILRERLLRFLEPGP